MSNKKRSLNGIKRMMDATPLFDKLETPEAKPTVVAATTLTAVPGSFADEAAVQTYLVTLRGEMSTHLAALRTHTNLLSTRLVAAGILV